MTRFEIYCQYTSVPILTNCLNCSILRNFLSIFNVVYSFGQESFDDMVEATERDRSETTRPSLKTDLFRFLTLARSRFGFREMIYRAVALRARVVFRFSSLKNPQS